MSKSSKKISLELTLAEIYLLLTAIKYMDQGSPKKLGDNFEKIRTKLIAKIETQNPET